MHGSQSLEQRLAGYTARGGRSGARSAFRGAHLRGLRPRVDRLLDEAVSIFELDRLLYDIEIDAQHAWLRNLIAFDAFCARRAGPGGEPAAPPVR
jgi:hypothetical protein